MNDLSFPAQVYKVQTLVDGGIRVTLDLPETAIPQMAMLAECQRQGKVLTVTALEAEQEAAKPSKYSHYKKDGQTI